MRTTWPPGDRDDAAVERGGRVVGVAFELGRGAQRRRRGPRAALRPCCACTASRPADARRGREARGRGRRGSAHRTQSGPRPPALRKARTAGWVSGAGSSPSADTSRWMPSATATASNAGPRFADDAGTRTTQPSCTRVSLARSRSLRVRLPRLGAIRQVPSMHDRASRRPRVACTKRQCARFGCSAVATATYTFDSATCTVWLDTPLEGSARAPASSAHRHARSLTPPRGWQPRGPPTGRGAASRPAARRSRSSRAPVEADCERADGPRGDGAPGAGVGGAAAAADGRTGRELEDELRGLLDAHSPLLARAFRSSGTV